MKVVHQYGKMLQTFSRERGHVDAALVQATWDEVQQALCEMAADIPESWSIGVELELRQAFIRLAGQNYSALGTFVIRDHRDFSCPLWMPMEVHDAAILTSLRSGLELYTFERVKQEVRDCKLPDNSLRYDMNIWTWMGGSWLAPFIREYAAILVAARPWPQVMEQVVYQALFDILFALFVSAAAGKVDTVARFEPTISMMSRGYLLIGLKREDLTIQRIPTLLALCARA